MTTGGSNNSDNKSREASMLGSTLTMATNLSTGSTLTIGSSQEALAPPGMGSSQFILVDEDAETKSSMKEMVSRLGEKARERVRKGCTKKVLHKRLPILRWLRTYTVQDGVGDLVAGLTVGLTVIPQALAYSNIAGLPTEYGLYGAFLGSLVYIVFGSCKDVPMGPTAIVSLLTYQAVNGKGPEYAILLCFLVGFVMLLMGLLGLGFLIDFVSGPVSSGFTSAVALIIVSSQVKDLLGVPAKGNTFVEMWSSIFEHIGSTRAWDCALGFICIVVLLLLRMVANIKVGPNEPEKQSVIHKVVNKLLWLVSTTRNATLVISTGVIGFLFHSSGQYPFRLIGPVPAGLPHFKLPPFGFTTQNNETVTFPEMMSHLGSSVIVIPVLALLENIAICKAFSAGKAIDATQEMIAIGLCNMANSFVQAFPGTGALARSAVNNASGVRTPMGGLYTGVLVIASLLVFTPYFQYIPKAALAAIIIAAVIFMVEVRVVKPMWRCKKVDLIPCLATFFVCLGVKIEAGIVVGVGINILFILYQAARPKISMERITSRAGTEYLLLTPDRCLIFPSVDYVRNLVTKHASGAKKQQANAAPLPPVVIDCSHIYGADYTAAGVIQSMTRDFAARGQPLLFLNLKPSVVAVFEGLQPEQFVCFYEENDIDMLLAKRKPPV